MQEVIQLLLQRVIKEFSKDNESLEVVGLYFDGTLYDPSKYKELKQIYQQKMFLLQSLFML